MAQQHIRQLLLRLETLPGQLIHPTFQVAKHRSFISVAPQPVPTLLDQVRLHDATIQGKQSVELPSLLGVQIHPARQQ